LGVNVENEAEDVLLRAITENMVIGKGHQYNHPIFPCRRVDLGTGIIYKLMYVNDFFGAKFRASPQHPVIVLVVFNALDLQSLQFVVIKTAMNLERCNVGRSPTQVDEPKVVFQVVTPQYFFGAQYSKKPLFIHTAPSRSHALIERSEFSNNPSAFASYKGVCASIGGACRSVADYSLPNDAPQRQDERPRGNTFRPCYEFVPPLRFILAILCLGCAVAINGYGRGWRRLLSIVPFLCTGGLILGGHKYWCQDNNREYECDPNSHSGTIVLQKYLTQLYSCNTVIDMANVLNTDKQIAIIGALAEGSSIRSIERITGIHRDTIMRLGVKVGQGCAALLDAKMRDLPCQHLQFDEIWGFIGKKQRNLLVDDDETQYGDVWTFCAIDADTKLVPSFRCGKRDAVTANAFVEDVASRMRTRVQVTTDALRLYVEAIERGFGADVDYGRVIKTYAHDDSIHPERRYSAPEIVTTEKEIVNGHPDMELASTSHVERLNGTTRLHMRRLTRLTYAFSKKLENFKAAAALHFAYYNLVKRHGTLRCTPAMAAGVEQSFWTVGDLVEATV
jgi:IS1 family transposase